MKKILTLFVLSCYSFCYAQNKVEITKVVYDSAYLKISGMFKENDKISFKEAIFITENAFFHNKLPISKINKHILFLASICKQFNEANALQNYTFKDRNTVALRASVFKVITDTIYTILPNEKKAYHLPFSYDFDDFFGEQDWTKTFVIKLLDTEKGNCRSLPYLYKILCEELGVTAHLALAPNHVYIKHKSEKTGWYNTELTSATFPVDAWLMASGYVHLSAIQNGVYMKALSDKECIALCLVDLAEGYKRKTDYKDTDFILKCCDTALLHFPNCINALLLKVETLKHIFENPNVENAVEANEPNKIDEKRQKQFLEIQELYLKIHDLGYRQMPKEMYFEWLLDLKTEKDKYLNKNVGGSKKR
jgi:hypothetical protein